MKQNIVIEKEFSAIILAAGKSERLGFPKLSLKYNKDNIFIEHIVKEFNDFGCKEIVLVVNEVGNQHLKDNNIRFADNLKIVINKRPDWHRFYSLKTGVKELSKLQPTFIHNVDNPFISPKVLNALLANSTKADYLAPEYKKKGGHPILISELIVKDIISTISNQLHLKEFLNQYSKSKITIDDEKVLVNINTMEEYQKYFPVIT